MKFIRFGEGFNYNHALLSDIRMLFNESLVKEFITRPHFYEYIGNYIRLTLLENDLLSVGMQHTYPEDDTIFMDRKELIRLLEQREALEQQKFQIYYLIMENDHFEFTSTFPTKHALLLKKGEKYGVTECEDQELKILAEFLSYYKRTNNHESFAQDKRFFIQKVDWFLGNLTLKDSADLVCIFNEKNQHMKVFITDLTKLMTEWQKLLAEDPEKIYLVLENGHYRLTTDYTPEKA